MTTQYDNYETAAQNIINRVGKTIVIGVPLGLGKPIGILNALYRIAERDPSISLMIVTGLTFSRPLLRNPLEKNFIEPLLERLLKDYEDPLYERARELQKLPKNINVIEFFLSPGKYLHNSYVQQNYISSSYTNVVRDTIYFSINVLAQQVARSTTNPDSFSLSCNPDLFSPIEKYLRKKQATGAEVAVVAEVNMNLPFMYGELAVFTAKTFTDIVDTKKYRTLFAVPRDEISWQDHLIGLYTSCLIKDDGCLQVGIGSLSNAVACALILRHKQNNLYLELLNKLGVKNNFGTAISEIGELGTFNKGIYASTEMLSDEYMHLYHEGILKKRVYDNIKLQRLLNQGKIDENISSKTIDVLLENKIIRNQLTSAKVKFLKKFGIFKSDVHYENGYLLLPSGELVLANLKKEKKKIIEHCLGDKLKSGKIVHAGFFFGSTELYRQLHELPDAIKQQIEMTSVARTNSLTWSTKLLTEQRQHARFVNSTMMITCSGAIVSDGLKDLQEVSGVGGQYDFQSMAQDLDGARAIINCRSTRETKQGTQSNIVWDYPNQTISRYLRDIIVTEYGIADCRSRTDSEIIKCILNVTDSRFQQDLLQKSKRFGKVAQDYEIPMAFRQNYPKNFKALVNEYQTQGCFQPYPFGSDFTDDEIVLAHALLYLKNCSQFKLMLLMIRALLYFPNVERVKKYLVRMKLDSVKNIKDFISKKLLIFVIDKKGQNYVEG